MKATEAGEPRQRVRRSETRQRARVFEIKRDKIRGEVWKDRGRRGKERRVVTQGPKRQRNKTCSEKEEGGKESSTLQKRESEKLSVTD